LDGTYKLKYRSPPRFPFTDCSPLGWCWPFSHHIWKTSAFRPLPTRFFWPGTMFTHQVVTFPVRYGNRFDFWGRSRGPQVGFVIFLFLSIPLFPPLVRYPNPESPPFATLFTNLRVHWHPRFFLPFLFLSPPPFPWSKFPNKHGFSSFWLRDFP